MSVLLKVPKEPIPVDSDECHTVDMVNRYGPVWSNIVARTAPSNRATRSQLQLESDTYTENRRELLVDFIHEDFGTNRKRSIWKDAGIFFYTSIFFFVLLLL